MSNYNVNPKRSFLCECTNTEPLSNDMVSLEIAWPGPLPAAGQFFLIKARRSALFLGRPISVAGCKAQAGASGGTQGSGAVLVFLIALRGPGSRELADLKPGEQAELIGPLGNSWKEMEYEGSGPIALLAGGIGIAPLLAYTRELKDKSFDFYAGFRSSSLGGDVFSAKLISNKEIKPRSLIIATEDGSLGSKGLITHFFDPSSYSAVFACGPEPMLKAAAQVCIKAGVPCFISTERHMACGVGACLGCTLKTVNGNQCCCTEGPIFNARELVFDE